MLDDGPAQVRALQTGGIWAYCGAQSRTTEPTVGTPEGATDHQPDDRPSSHRPAPQDGSPASGPSGSTSTNRAEADTPADHRGSSQRSPRPRPRQPTLWTKRRPMLTNGRLGGPSPQDRPPQTAGPGGSRNHDIWLRRTQVRSPALEPRQTCYGFEAELQAVAPFQEQWHGNSTLIRGKLRRRQRQDFAGRGLHLRTPVGGPQVLASA